MMVLSPHTQVPSPIKPLIGLCCPWDKAKKLSRCSVVWLNLSKFISCHTARFLLSTYTGLWFSDALTATTGLCTCSSCCLLFSPPTASHSRYLLLFLSKELFHSSGKNKNKPKNCLLFPSPVGYSSNMAPFPHPKSKSGWLIKVPYPRDSDCDPCRTEQSPFSVTAIRALLL